MRTKGKRKKECSGSDILQKRMKSRETEKLINVYIKGRFQHDIKGKLTHYNKLKALKQKPNIIAK